MPDYRGAFSGARLLCHQAIHPKDIRIGNKETVSILISAKGIKKTFGSRPLFEGLTFVVESGERIGLIGPNGAGKSTLLAILAGKHSVDDGELSMQRGLKTGYLTQTPTLPLEETVDEAIFGAIGDDDHGEAMALAGELISKLDLSQFSNQKCDTLSGGWRKRVALARELLKEPELLLLDEPTNHLDIESILWLEDFLARATFATITVTHDRLFLQRISNRILELDKRNPQGLLNVRGDYATYLDRKEEMMSLQQREETVLKNKLRRETEWLRRGPKARTTKQTARINAAYDLMDEVDELSYRNTTKSARLDFQSSDKQPKRLIEARKINKKYGNRVLFKNLDLYVGPGSRIGLLGSNGCGKSTLIRALLGLEEPDSGQIIRSEHLKVSYFEQNREALDPQLTLRRTVCPHGDNVMYRGKPVHIHGYLDRFLFRKEQIDMPIRSLSGGEQSRVLIAMLMLHEANVLVLDEPTNDLDVETLDVLQDCLTEFDGAVLLVTHDRYFLDQVAKEIYAFPANGSGQIIDFAGLDQWETWHKNQSREPVVEKPNAAPSASSTSDKPKKKLGFNETRELTNMEGGIQKAEAKLLKLQGEASSPDNQSNAAKLSELYEAMAAAQAEVDRLYARWTELETLKNS